MRSLSMGYGSRGPLDPLERAIAINSRIVSKRKVSAWFSPVALYSDFVVDGTLNPLFATEIAFGCLNRNVTEQKLNLLQFAARGVAKHRSDAYAACGISGLGRIPDYAECWRHGSSLSCSSAHGPRRTADYPQDSPCIESISESRFGMISDSA